MSQYKRVIAVRERDTRPLVLQINATDLPNLASMSSARLYLWKDGEVDPHVNGRLLTLVSSALRTLSFDPVGAKNPSGNALDIEGSYAGFTKLTFADGRVVRFPGNATEDLVVIVSPSEES